MNQHVERHCHKCTNCQKFKLPQPTRAPLTSVPIGKPWQMVAVDTHLHQWLYLLVIQDYFTKWAIAIDFIWSMSPFLSKETADPESNIISTETLSTSPMITVALLLTVATVIVVGLGWLGRQLPHTTVPFSIPYGQFSIHDQVVGQDMHYKDDLLYCI